MRYIYGGATGNLSRFGPVAAGAILDLRLEEALAVVGNANFSRLPTRSQIRRIKTAGLTLTNDYFGHKLVCQQTAPMTVTLPAAPYVGWWVEIEDASVAGAGTNAITVAANTGQTFTPAIHVKTGSISDVEEIDPGSPGTMDYSPLVAGDVVLVMANTDKTTNGLYVVGASNQVINDSLRDPRANSSAKMEALTVIVDHGSNDVHFHDGDIYEQQTPQPILGQSDIVFKQAASITTRILAVDNRSVGYYWNGVFWVAF